MSFSCPELYTSILDFVLWLLVFLYALYALYGSAENKEGCTKYSPLFISFHFFIS
jgi:hypothetical protein